MELMDYLEWRNDVSLRAAPFNEIDNVLLSYLAYADFGELLHEPKRHVSIETCFKRFCEKHDLSEVRESKHFIERAPLLLEEMLRTSERFLIRKRCSSLRPLSFCFRTGPSMSRFAARIRVSRVGKRTF